MALAVVQAGSNADRTTLTQPTVAWGAGPTHGNLLVAKGYIRNGVTPTPINGWGFAAVPLATANWFLICYFKYAGVSEPTTQAIDTNAGLPEWGLEYWEISGITGNFWQDVVAVHFGAQNGAASSLPAGSLTTKGTTSLVLADYAGQFSANTTTISWAGNTGWTFDSSVVESVGDGFGVFNWASGGHQFVSGGATVSSTITTSANALAWTGGYVELGLAPSPGIDGAPVSTQTGSGSPITSLATPTVQSLAANDVIVLAAALTAFAAASPPTGAVTSVTASGLTFNRRFTANAAGLGAQNTGTQEIWTAPAVSPFSGALTANFSGLSGTNNVAALIAFAVGGCTTPSAPFDTDASLPAHGAASASWNTSLAPDLILGVGSYFIPGAVNVPVVSGGPTWTLLQGAGLQFGSTTAGIGVYTAHEAAPISGQTSTINVGEIIYVDALSVGTTAGNASGALGSGLTIGAMTASAAGAQVGVASGPLGSGITIGTMTGMAVVDAVEKSSKVVAYAVVGRPDDTAVVSKVVAGAVTGPPDASLKSPKVVAYAVLGPPPPRPRRSVRVVMYRGQPL